MTKLRDYQNEAIRLLHESIRGGHKRIICCVPTGGGKSTIFSYWTKLCVKNKKRGLFMVHSKELVEQFSARLRNQFNLSSGVIMAGAKPDPSKPVQVASVQTLARRKKPDVDFVIIDECHRSNASTYKKIIEYYPDAIIVGLTATPFRGDGKPLGDIYTDIVHPIKIRQLIEMGFLVPTRVAAPENSVSMDGVKIVRGDFDSKEMGRRFKDGAITRGVVENYLHYAKGKKAIVFNCDVAHSKEMHERFLAAGVRSAHADGTTPKDERERIVKGFASGKYEVLNSVAIYTEGFDIPDTECVILNRATNSEGLYIQMVGRGLRPAKGKEECLVIDHGGNTLRFGYVEDYDQAPFSLEEKKKASKKAMKCKQCNTGIMKYDPKSKHFICSDCGHSYNTEKKRSRTFSDGQEFAILDRDVVLVERLIKMQHSRALKRLPPSQYRLYALLRGYKPGWWFHKAIEQLYSDIHKDDPQAWQKVKHRLEMEELQNDTFRIYQEIKSQTDGTNRTIQGSERRVLSA